MKLKPILIILAVFCMFWAFGCGNSDFSPGDEGTITVEVINYSGGIVSYAVFFGDGEYEWGIDELGDEIIPNGETHIFTLPEGRYYFLPYSYENYILGSFIINNEDATVEIGGEGKIAVLIRNRTDVDIYSLYFSPVEDEEWGENLLGFRWIDAGTGNRVVYVLPGNYDLMANDIEGNIVMLSDDLFIEKPITINIE